MKYPVLLFVFCCVGYSVGYEDKTVVQWLSDNGFPTLVGLLKSSNLYSVLDGPGPFTLFAPSDSAFGILPSDTLSLLTSDSNLLQSVLKFHVMNGFVLSAMLKDGETKSTLNGDSVTVSKTGSDVSINGVQITQPDVILSNGVVHVMNSVLLPPLPSSGSTSLETLGELLLRNQTQFSTLNLLLTITDLEPVLMGGNYTLFAPTNAAFNAIVSSLPDLNAPGAKGVYIDTLKNHLVNGVIKAADLRDGQQVTMLSGRTVTIHINPSVKVNNANVITADVMASNGVMHVIDAVLT